MVPIQQPKLLCSTLLGVTCHPPPHAAGMASLRAPRRSELTATTSPQKGYILRRKLVLKLASCIQHDAVGVPKTRHEHPAFNCQNLEGHDAFDLPDVGMSELLG